MKKKTPAIKRGPGHAEIVGSDPRRPAEDNEGKRKGKTPKAVQCDRKACPDPLFFPLDAMHEKRLVKIPVLLVDGQSLFKLTVAMQYVLFKSFSDAGLHRHCVIVITAHVRFFDNRRRLQSHVCLPAPRHPRSSMSCRLISRRQIRNPNFRAMPHPWRFSRQLLHLLTTCEETFCTPPINVQSVRGVRRPRAHGQRGSSATLAP